MTTRAYGLWDTAMVQTAPPRPLLRGILHLVAAMFAIVGLVALLLTATSPSGYVGASIYGAGLILLYSTSAAYHRLSRRPALHGVLRRLDHGMIFVLIGATYTPFCLGVLDLAWGIPMLAVVWSIAALGVMLKVAWIGLPKWLGVSLYVALGWMAVVIAPEVASELAIGGLALLVGGGVLYTVGGVAYGLAWPNPWPRVFGFHEVFHSFVIGGSALHYAAVALYAVGP
ncbi:MAG TPA: hemolysin III family protein [Dehalococcoidia bacterium]|nr:hemolysin III family protein [Dehalococcoidia bacterium]